MKRRSFFTGALSFLAAPVAAVGAPIAQTLPHAPISRKLPNNGISGTFCAADFDGDAVSLWRHEYPARFEGRGFTTCIFHVDESPFQSVQG